MDAAQELRVETRCEEDGAALEKRRESTHSCAATRRHTRGRDANLCHEDLGHAVMRMHEFCCNRARGGVRLCATACACVRRSKYIHG